MLDRFDCYELCVQSPRHLLPFLRSVHGRNPAVLREDFCGTAALSSAWIQGPTLSSSHTPHAVAIDIDPEALAKARAHTEGTSLADRIEFRQRDCTAESTADRPATDPSDACDVIFVGNFSIGYIHDRSTLVRYLRQSYARLHRGPDHPAGVFVCDTYGGITAFRRGTVERHHPGPKGQTIRYTWAHEAADPLTGMVENSITFRIEQGGEIVRELCRAFTYRWRLWTIPELRDAMHEAGFQATAVYTDVTPCASRPPSPVLSDELADDWIVLVVGFTAHQSPAELVTSELG